MKVKTKEQAWAEVNKIFPTLNYYNRICDLGCRIEVLTGEYGEKVVNIWIEPMQAEQSPKMGVYRKHESMAGVVKGEYEPSKAWRVYLTKSEQAAYEISHGFGCDMEARVNGVTAVKCGKVDERDGRLLLPPLYHGKGYYYAAKEHGNTDNGATEIIIC